MAADVLATQGAGTSVAMVLILFSQNIPILALKGLTLLFYKMECFM